MLHIHALANNLSSTACTEAWPGGGCLYNYEVLTEISVLIGQNCA